MFIGLATIGVGIIAFLIRLYYIGYLSDKLISLEAPLIFAILFFVLSVIFSLFFRRDFAPVLELGGFIALFVAARKALRFGEYFGFRK